MTPNLGYQFYYIWNQLKRKQTGTYLKGFLKWIIGGGNAHVKFELHFLVTAYIKEHRERKLFLFASVSSFSLVSSSVLLRHSVTGIGTDSFVFQYRLNTYSSLRLRWDFSATLGL